MKLTQCLPSRAWRVARVPGYLCRGPHAFGSRHATSDPSPLALPRLPRSGGRGADALRALRVCPGRAKAAPTFVNGMAQVVPAFQDTSTWIRQELWVETNFDSDHDGKKDRVHVDVTRPRQTETEGLKVSILYGSSPYFAGTARGQVNWNVEQELNDKPQPRGSMASPIYQANRSRSRTRSSTSGCRAASRSCTPRRRARGARRDARRSATTRSVCR